MVLVHMFCSENIVFIKNVRWISHVYVHLYTCNPIKIENPIV